MSVCVAMAMLLCVLGAPEWCAFDCDSRESFSSEWERSEWALVDAVVSRSSCANTYSEKESLRIKALVEENRSLPSSFAQDHYTLWPYYLRVDKNMDVDPVLVSELVEESSYLCDKEWWLFYSTDMRVVSMGQ